MHVNAWRAILRHMRVDGHGNPFLAGAAVHDDIKFHTDRALAELDRAAKAADRAAAEAHLALSALHLERLRLLAHPFSAQRATG